MITPRVSSAATLLRDGRVVITGGTTADFRSCVKSAELYDPSTGTFTAAGDFSWGVRWGFSTTLLKDGRVLLSGGVIDSIQNRLAVLYDPATNTFSRTGGVTHGAPFSTANLLPDGTVLIAGGLNDTSATLYHPATDWFEELTTGRWQSMYHSTTSLPNGKVLLAGGSSDNYGFDAQSKTALYNSASRILDTTGRLLRPRDFHTATLLKDGRVLITGGYNEEGLVSGILSSAELYDPSTETFLDAGNMTKGREGHTATLLADGRVLIAGGIAGYGWPPLQNDASAELFIPTSVEGPLLQTLTRQDSILRRRFVAPGHR